MTDFDLSADFEASEITINDDITTAPIQKPEPGGMFALSKNHFLQQFHAAKAKDKSARRGVKRFIKPENAQCLAPYLPDPGDTTHAIVRGDFVLAEIIPVILKKKTAETNKYILIGWI